MKKLLILTTVVVLTLMIAVSIASADGNGATVLHLPEDGVCGLPWFDLEGNFVFLENDSGILLDTNSPNGNTVGICKGTIDFDDPNLATLEQGCDFFPAGCNENGNGPLVFNFDNFNDLCGIGDPADPTFTEDWTYRITPGGQAIITCHFNPSS